MFRGNPLAGWALFFLALSTSNVNGFGNVQSRLAALAAFAETGSMRIDEYVKRTWTDDWSRTPDGAYYSNKAPGPTLLAAPLYWVLDRAGTMGIETRTERDDRRYYLRHFFNIALSWGLQVLPWALLMLSLGRRLAREQARPLQVAVMGLALSAGSTAAVFMNSFFGHGFAALWTTLTTLALIDGRLRWAGLCYGMALLTDYGSAMLLPGFLWAALAMRESGEMNEGTRPRFWVRIREIAIGAALPGLAWIAYHWLCFGHPLWIANRFQNPVFVDVPTTTAGLWGVIAFFPDPLALKGLLWGGNRSLLITQPWVLFVVPILVAILARAQVMPPLRRGAVFAVFGFFGLFWMNAAFGGWHGGGSPGPRYLSAILPSLAVVYVLGLQEFAARGYTKLNEAALATALVLMAPAALLTIVALSTFIVVDLAPLWPTYWRHVAQAGSKEPWIRIGLFAFLTIACLVWTLRPEGRRAAALTRPVR